MAQHDHRDQRLIAWLMGTVEVDQDAVPMASSHCGVGNTWKQ